MIKNISFIKLVMGIFIYLSSSENSIASQFIQGGTELELQRSFYKELIDNNRAGKINPESYIKSLEAYPLFPYLKYYQLLYNLGAHDLQKYQDFFDQHDDLAVSSHLRKQLLLLLGKRKDWANFEKFYKKEDYFFSDSQLLEIHCLHLNTQFVLQQEKGPVAKSFYEEIKEVWLDGNSLPDVCNNIIEVYSASGLLTQDLRLQRIQLAITRNNLSLANFMAKQLSGTQAQEFAVWQKISSQPKQLENTAREFADTTFIRFAITHTLMKLLRDDPPLALVLWKEKKSLYQFTQDEITKFTEDASLYLIINDSEHLLTWFEIANPQFRNPLLNEKELVVHLKNKDWPAIINLYDKVSAKEKTESFWQYWYSRSHIEYDQSLRIHPNAYRILDELSRKRDYYGFLASLHLHRAPVFSHQQFPVQDKALEKMSLTKGIQRAHEFYILQDLTNANREWREATSKMSEEQKGIAAVLALQWGWHEQAIKTAAKSSQFNNIILRFPLAFSTQVNYYTSTYGIPNEWAFAIIRQESAFGLKAESPAGALGLMQIMPATGRALAKEHNLKNFNTSQLLNFETNIQLGTYYLSKLKKQYQGNMVLASAAYNAGPSRVNSWINNSRGKDLDIEMWIETIPYKETRDYVKNVLTYQMIYQHRLGRETNSEYLFLALPDR